MATKNEQEDFASKVEEIAFEVSDILKSKNIQRGGLATNPLQMFSEADARERNNFRIDHTLGKMVRDPSNLREHRMALIGFLIIGEVLDRQQDEANEPATDKKSKKLGAFKNA